MKVALLSPASPRLASPRRWLPGSAFGLSPASPRLAWPRWWLPGSAFGLQWAAHHPLLRERPDAVREPVEQDRHREREERPADQDTEREDPRRPPHDPRERAVHGLLAQRESCRDMRGQGGEQRQRYGDDRHLPA